MSTEDQVFFVAVGHNGSLRPFGEKTNRACVEVEVGFIGVVCSGKGNGLRRFASCREHAARVVTPLPLPTWNRNPVRWLDWSASWGRFRDTVVNLCSIVHQFSHGVAIFEFHAIKQSRANFGPRSMVSETLTLLFWEFKEGRAPSAKPQTRTFGSSSSHLAQGQEANGVLFCLCVATEIFLLRRESV